jgi:hypothetical protein
LPLIAVAGRAEDHIGAKGRRAEQPADNKTMKVNDTHSGTAATGVAAGAQATTGGGPVATVERVTPVAPTERVTTEQTEEVQGAVVRSVALAASERALRLQTLAQAVRSGNYRPSATALAEQMLAAAELEAKLRKL